MNADLLNPIPWGGNHQIIPALEVRKQYAQGYSMLKLMQELCYNQGNTGKIFLMINPVTDEGLGIIQNCAHFSQLFTLELENGYV
jgi:hypothetical protein